MREWYGRKEFLNILHAAREGMRAIAGKIKERI